MSIRMADVAPRPAKSVTGLRLMMMATTMMTAMNTIKTRNTLRKEKIYCCVEVRRSPSSSLMASMKTNTVRTDITTI